MKTLYLHIGLGKTGSSALQSWLSLNSPQLHRQGYSYADLVPEAKLGRTSSGNGFVLSVALENDDYAEAERLITDCYFTDDCERAIVSCEQLRGLSRNRLAILQDILKRNGIEVTVIAYVRSFYEHLYSTYAQSVKRGQASHAYGTDPEDLDTYKYIAVLMKYARHFRDRFVVLNYNDPERDVFTSFAAATGVDLAGTEPLTATVNRSLTIGETEALLEINRLHDGQFSPFISDFLVEQHPDRRSEILYREGLVEEVRAQGAAEIAWINHQFQLLPPLQADHYPGSPREATPGQGASVFTAASQWALAFRPHAGQALAFAEFLRKFAGHLAAADATGAARLRARADEVEKEWSDRAIRGGHGDGAPEEERDYLIAYLLPERALSAEEQKVFSLALTRWIAPLRKSSVGAMLNSLQQPVQFIPGEKTPQREIAGVKFTGYTVVRSRSPEQLLELVSSCPVLDVGGTVQVFHHEAVAFA